MLANLVNGHDSGAPKGVPQLSGVDRDNNVPTMFDLWKRKKSLNPIYSYGIPSIKYFLFFSR